MGLISVAKAMRVWSQKHGKWKIKSSYTEGKQVLQNPEVKSAENDDTLSEDVRTAKEIGDLSMPYLCVTQKHRFREENGSLGWKSELVTELRINNNNKKSHFHFDVFSVRSVNFKKNIRTLNFYHLQPSPLHIPSSTNLGLLL